MSRKMYRRFAEPPADAETYIEWVRRSRRPDFELLLIARLDGGGLVGGATLSQIARGSLQSAYLGYFGFVPTIGQGHMTEGVMLTLKHAFVTLALHRVEANIQPGNEPSIRLAERCGFRNEGFSPRYLKISGRWRDHHRYAMTIEDWRRHRRP
ncbi:MAG: GCN5-related N-acetyltransferase [Acidimicrobiales bacterium]|nr:GCN5-related N-acetyltransferase [Acidimicrobiales bacterium]